MLELLLIAHLGSTALVARRFDLVGFVSRLKERGIEHHPLVAWHEGPDVYSCTTGGCGSACAVHITPRRCPSPEAYYTGPDDIDMSHSQSSYVARQCSCD